MTDCATTIRPASLADVPAMTGLLAELFALEPDFRIDPERQARGLVLLFEEPAFRRAFVAERDGLTAGMCSVQLVVSTAEGGLSALLEDMVVAREARGRGVGGLLLEAARQWAAGRGATRMQLLADRENDPALEFYGKNGWSRTRMICLRTTIA